MAAINDIFATLAQKYRNYEDLRTFLVTLGIQVNTKEGDPLVIMRYNRETADLKNPITRSFRSVVWDSSANRPVFVAPMKSEPMAEMPAVFPPTLVTEEFIDGVMVNVFFDTNKQIWRLATRSRLDADNKFFDQTFDKLFMQAWQTLGMPPDFSNLNKFYGYSFVLQHPANRNVVPVVAPHLTCVEICSIAPNLFLHTMPAAPTLLPPRRFAASSAIDCDTLLTTIQQFEGLKCQGIVVRDTATGKRWKMRTIFFNLVRKMRGNHSRLEYTWLENFKNGALEVYLSYYPEERTRAEAVIRSWQKAVSETYNWYVHIFKARDCSKDKIPAQYKGMLYDLHGQYLTRLAPLKQSLTWQEHQSIMGRQDLKRMVFLATYPAAK